MFSTSVDKVNASGNIVNSNLSYTCDISTDDLGTFHIETDVSVNATAPNSVEPTEELQITNFWTEVTFNELPFIQAIMDSLSGQITGFDLNAVNAVNADDQNSHTYNVVTTPIDFTEPLIDGEDTVTFKFPQKNSVDAGSFIAGEEGEVVITPGEIEMSINSDLGEMPVHCSLADNQDNGFITIPIEENDGSDTNLDPIIEINGDELIELEVGEEYNDPGAIAKDHKGNDLTDGISITGEVDTNKAGQYTITYSVEDSEGNTSKVNRTVLVKKSQDPIEPGDGDNQLTYVSLGDSLAAGYLNYPDKVVIGNGYPYFIKQGIEEGTDYQVTLINRSFGGFTTSNVLDQLQNNTSNVLDRIAEADLITYDAGANDLLATIDTGNLDNIDEETAGKLVEEVLAMQGVIKNNIDASLQIIQEHNPDVPVYVMGYYNALPWKEGDQTQELIKLGINIMNDAIEGAAEANGAIYIPTWDAFVGNYDEFLPNENIHPMENGYQAIADEFLKEIMPTLPSPEDPTDPDTESPVIELNGSSSMELVVGDIYEEPGATAKDNVDGDISDNIEITGNVDTSTVGSYEVIYTVSDEAGNVATETRVVQVIELTPEPDPEDSIKPVIELKGENPMEIEVGEEYEEPGATAEDNVDGDITDNIEVEGKVDTSTVGSYEVVYTVVDAAGNKATETRMVYVIDLDEDDDNDEEEDISVGVSGSDGETNGSGTLPITATSNLLFIALGTWLLLAGGGTIVARRKLIK